MTSGEWLKLSVLPFPHLKNKDADTGFQRLELLLGLNELIHVKCS